MNAEVKPLILHQGARRPGTRVSECCICGMWGLVEKHHSQPSENGAKPRGPLWLVCVRCHALMHDNFTNSELRKMTVETLRASLRYNKETSSGAGAKPQSHEETKKTNEQGK